MTPVILACLPPHLHPVSAQILEMFLSGSLPLEEFRRLFSLPNSDYLPVTDCILRVLHIAIPPAEM
jgi:hypothetical protein